MRASRLIVPPLAALALALACQSVSAQERTVVTEGFGQPAGGAHRFVINFGMEVASTYLHPGAPGFIRSMEAFGFDPIAGLFNLNAVAEVLFPVGEHWEVGPHFGYNGLFAHTGPPGRDFELTSQEFGAAARLLIGKNSRRGAVNGGFRFEGGFVRSVFTVADEDEVDSTFFVRPALSFATVGSGVEFTLGWTFSMVIDGFGTQDLLPLGGLDAGLLIRIAP